MKRYHRLYLPEFSFMHSLAPVVVTLYWFMGTWMISRLALLLGWWGQAIKESQLHLLVPISLRFDFLTFSYGIGGLLLLLLATPSFVMKRGGKFFWQWIFTIFYGLVVFLEMAAWPFLREYGNRPDRHALEFWATPQEVFSMLFKGFGPELFVATLVSVWLAYLFGRSWKKMLAEYVPFHWVGHIGTWVLLLAIFIVGGRSSLGHRPANISSASFSSEHIVNQLTLNSAYSFAYSAYRMKHEENPVKIYAQRSGPQMIERLKRLAQLDGKLMPTGSQQVHWTMSANPTADGGAPPNIFIVIEESLGAEFVGSLGGMNLTPHLDAKGSEGLLFTQMYATGTRTARGLEALLTGFPPTPGSSVLKLGKAYNSFFTIAKALRPFGYKSYFFCGGDGNFDEMKSFFMSNGFDHFVELNDLKHIFQVGSWGVHDDDLLQYAHDFLNKQQDQVPFLSVVLTSSNHSPFDYPVGEFQPSPSYPKDSHPNAILYADFALGKWFKNIETSRYRDNTVFLVVADHSTRVYGDKLIPVHKFHIPAVMWGPGVPKGTFDKLASAIDLPPTLLTLTGLPIQSPMLGYNLFNLPPAFPGRALMQYHDHLGYKLGDNLVVLRPQLPAEVFHYAQGVFTSLPADSEFIEDTYAYSLGAWELYDRQLYR